MFKELVDRIAELAVRANSTTVVNLAAEPDHVYLLARPDGTADVRHAGPKPRRHVAGSLDTVVTLAKEHAETSALSAVIWYSRKAIVCLLDDATRRDQVRFDLQCSKQIETLQVLEGIRKPFKQAELLSLLRVTFAKCLDQTGNLVEILRRIKFRQASAGESVVQHGKSSLGRSVEAELTGTGALPEYVTLHVPIWTNLVVGEQSVQCALEPDAATETFQLIPLPGEIENATQRAERVIYERLLDAVGDAPIAVYLGTP